MYHLRLPLPAKQVFRLFGIGTFWFVILLLLGTIFLLQREVSHKTSREQDNFLHTQQFSPQTPSQNTAQTTTRHSTSPTSTPRVSPSSPSVEQSTRSTHSTHTPSPIKNTSQTPTAVPTVSSMRSWKVLALIYRSTNATYSSQGTSKQMNTTMTESQVSDTVNTLLSLPTTISSWSNGFARMNTPSIVYPTRSITSLSSIGDGFWVSPQNVKSDIDQYAPKGTYDSIFVIWRKDDDNNVSIPSFGWGWSNGPSENTNGAGYSVISLPEGKRTFAQADGYPGEIFVHEWNHQTTSFYQSKGFGMPDIDRAPSYGYGVSSTNSWQSFLSDVMQGKVRSGDSYLGITQAMWNSATPTQP